MLGDFAKICYKVLMKIFTIATSRKDEVIDITERIEDEVRKSNIKNGVCSIFIMHTTCALTTAELDPGSDLDLLDGLRNLLPDMEFRHPHNPSHMPDHILSSVIGPNIAVHIQNGELMLGIWQRIVLIEFNGPKQRNITISFLEERLVN